MFTDTLIKQNHAILLKKKLPLFYNFLIRAISKSLIKD